MNALDLIKQGIASGDMSKVSKGYAMMTGEKIQPSQITDNHVSQLKAIFGDLQGSSTPEPEKEETFVLTPGESEEIIDETLLINDVEAEEKILSDEDVSPANLGEGEVLIEEEEAEPEVQEIIRPGVMKAKPHKLIIPGGEVALDNDSEEEVRGSRKCSAVAFPIRKRINKFKDNLAIASKDLAFDKKVRSEDSIEAHKYIEKRDAEKPVKVRCRGCDRRFMISPKMAPIRYDSSDSMSYECNSCTIKKHG